MKKIIIISDSHANNYDIELILKNNTYDYAISAGDYETNLAFIEKNFDFHVKGNNDFDSNKNEIFFEIEGIKFYLQHGHLMGNYFQLDNYDFMSPKLKELDVDVIIHGHTHIPKIWKVNDNQFIINPGSITYPRGNSNPCYIIGYIEKNNVSFEIKEL
ncbi:MAG: metallophosphoesterase family protein [Metamycoplasmataceae bacterium]